MANGDENLERFAYDACILVLEKFGIFKAPDDKRKQNKYVRHDFLSRISKSVVSFAIWIRSDFKNALEDRCKIADLGDNEIMWIFDDYLVLNTKFRSKHWVEKVCISLALCTEYIQFANIKDFTLSLNKLVIGWSEFFEKHLRGYFDEKGGFPKLYNYLEISQIDQLGNFQEAFISEYCLPYGAIECTKELAKEFVQKQGFNISLEQTIFGIKKLEYYLHEGFVDKMEQVKLGSCPNEDLFEELEKCKLRFLPGNKEPKPEKTSDSKEVSTFCSAPSDMETSPNAGSDASDSDISQNNLLGIPPHEEMLREIDPFFVENIPSPPKARSSSKSPARETNVPLSSSKSPAGESDASDSSKSSASESDGSYSSQSSSKSPERKSGASPTPRESSKYIDRESASSDTQPRSSPVQKELKERVEHIFTKLEDDMDALRDLLFEHSLLSVKSCRSESRMRVKDSKNKMPPKGPEGLI